jgi:PST family polysaccharide transporter
VKTRHLIRAAGWSSIATVTSQSSAFLRLAAVASVVGTAELGAYAIAASLTAAAAILGDGGFRELYLSRRADTATHDESILLGTAWAGVVGARLVIALLAIPLAYAATFFVAVPPRELVSMTALLAASPLITALANPALLGFERRGEFSPSGKVELVSQVAGLAYVLAGLDTWPTIWLLASSQIVVATSSLALSYAALKRPGRLRPDMGVFLAISRMSRPFFVVSATTYVTYNFDKLLIGAMLSPAAAGVYFMAQRLAEIPAQLHAATFGRTTLPFYAFKRESAGFQGSKRAAGRYLSATVLIFAVLTAVAALAALLPAVRAAMLQWSGVLLLLPIMLAASGARAACHVISPMLIIAGKVHLDARFKVIEAVIYLACLPVAIKSGGVLGAALMFLAIYLLSLFNRYRAMESLVDPAAPDTLEAR